MVRNCLQPAAPAAFGQVMVPYQLGDPQIFQRDRVIRCEQHACRLVREVTSLALDRLLLAPQQRSSFLAAFAASLAPADPTLCPDELLVCLAVRARIITEN